jgi:DNA polymerase-3 subunit epsilon
VIADWDQYLWTEFPLLILDFETTGFSSQDRICEVALAVTKGGETVREFQSLVNPLCYIDDGARDVHGISDADVANAPTFDELLPTISEFFFLDIPWVSHNMPFDMRMLDYSWPSVNWPRGIPTLCTLAYSKKHPTTRMRGTHKLYDLANYFGVDYQAKELHSAKYDVEILTGVVQKLMGRRKIGSCFTKYSHEWRAGK